VKIVIPIEYYDGIGMGLLRSSSSDCLMLGLGVPTPTHSLMYAMLKPYIMGPPN
jgi:hypothetical protein